MVNLVVEELSSTCRVKTQLPLPKFFCSPFIFTARLNNKPEQRKYFGFRLSSDNMLRLLRVPPFSYNIRMVEHRHSRETPVPGNKIGVCNFVFGTPWYEEEFYGQKLYSTQHSFLSFAL
jgi:hypothetical protein